MEHVLNIKEEQSDPIEWHDPKEYPFQVNGFAWFNQEKLYQRMPTLSQNNLPLCVKELANCTSGGQIRFKTDSVKLVIKTRLSGVVDIGHMAATGQSGFDVYIGEPGKQHYLATAIPPIHEKTYEATLWDFTSSTSELREVTINLPLYQGVEELLIGVEPDAIIEAPTPYISDKRVLFYGTSITQGSSASRPGMSYTNILSRRFQLEFINLGFSGSGKGEKEVATVIRDIENPACLVIDYEANVTPEEYETTLVSFIEIYREYHPLIPIIVMSRIPHALDIFPDQNLETMRRRNHSKKVVEQFKENGDTRIVFVDGLKLLGMRWHEGTVDGVHPNDYGFMKMANGLEAPLWSTLKSVGVV
uniref:SGNH hydrolase-type esterase domain-containing protein n=1 Tax=Batrachochytrium dendrobatidis (strain JAM81 / FGSC 10211) TaxID=684364 RepID=F4PFR5_BATDJ|eukprot:XP_006683448.1 hypothetical protein BATDEDRAFT_93208 [Batrachochytrium dendrobatidis JAM81]